MNQAMQKNAGSRGGYIALISVVFMAAALLVVISALGLGSFFSRMDILGSDFKEQSQALSEACLATARLKLAQNPGYAGNENIAVGSSTCQIVSAVASGTQEIVSTQGVFEGSYTNLRATLSAGGASILGLEQPQHF